MEESRYEKSFEFLRQFPWKNKNLHYLNRYINFISTRKTTPIKGNTQLHHIVPNCILKKSKKEKENIICLTLREHFLAHFMLAKTFPNHPVFKALYMLSGNKKTKSLPLYEQVMKFVSNCLPEYYKTHKNPNKGKHTIKETKKIFKNPFEYLRQFQWENKNSHYLERYIKFISTRKTTPIKGNTQLHHIIPHSMSGPNIKTNLVCLTLREHFIAHFMLAKAFPNHSVFNSLGVMNGNKKIKSLPLYKRAMIFFGKCIIEWRKIHGEPSKGRHHSKETIQLYRETRSGEKSPAAKITNKDVLKIIELYFIEKMSPKEIAENFIITRDTVSGIVIGDEWTSFTGFKKAHSAKENYESAIKLFRKYYTEEMVNELENRRIIKESEKKISRHLSEETKNKISNTLKGKYIGRHHSEETKNKIRNKLKGKQLSEETKNKISNALKNSQYVRSGENNVKAKLTNENVLQIIYMYFIKKITVTEISKKFNITYTIISHILVGDCWTSITYFNRVHEAKDNYDNAIKLLRKHYNIEEIENKTKDDFKNNYTVLTNKDVLQIVYLHFIEKTSSKEIIKKINNATISSISSILIGKTWRSFTGFNRVHKAEENYDNAIKLLKKYYGETIVDKITDNFKNNIHTKLTNKDVIDIVYLYFIKKNQIKEIAKKFNMAKSSISCLLNGTNWTSFTGFNKVHHAEDNYDNAIKLLQEHNMI